MMEGNENNKGNKMLFCLPLFAEFSLLITDNIWFVAFAIFKLENVIVLFFIYCSVCIGHIMTDVRT